MAHGNKVERRFQIVELAERIAPSTIRSVFNAPENSRGFNGAQNGLQGLNNAAAHSGNAAVAAQIGAHDVPAPPPPPSSPPPT